MKEERLHPTQAKILKLSEKVDLNTLSLRSIGSLINVSHPQQVNHHVKQLKAKGLIKHHGTMNLLRTLKRLKLKTVQLQKEVESVIDYLTIK